MTNEVTRLPVPEKLEPKNAERSLLQSVRGYFYSLYNSNERFRSLLASVGNKDAITGNHYFDRRDAVTMIKEAADEAKDMATMKAIDGMIYKHLVTIMKAHPELRTKLRRLEYARMEQQQQAAE
jgi:hypothetical protein